MVGAALCLFYLLLLSISEFIGFSWAYLIAGGRIDRVDYMVLQIFPWRRGSHANDWRRSRRRLHISLHHFAPARLRTAHGLDRTLHRAGDRNVRDAQSRLVRARCGLSLAGGIALRRVDRSGAVLYHAAFIRPNRYPEVWLNFPSIRRVLILTKTLNFALSGMAVTLQA